MSGEWRPEIRVVKDREAVSHQWRIELGRGLLLASYGDSMKEPKPAADLDQFVDELRRAVTAAHQLNIERA